MLPVEERIVVPPDHAIWIRGKVHQARWSPQMRYGIIEPVASFSRKTGLLVDRALVNVEEPGMLVLNTQEELQRIEAGSTVALLQPVKEVGPARQSEMQAGGPEAPGKELPEHLKPLLEQAHPSLTEPQTNKLVDLLHEFQDRFTTPEGLLGCTGLVKHLIDTETSKPIRQPPCSPPPLRLCKKSATRKWKRCFSRE